MYTNQFVIDKNNNGVTMKYEKNILRIFCWYYSTSIYFIYKNGYAFKKDIFVEWSIIIS